MSGDTAGRCILDQFQDAIGIRARISSSICGCSKQYCELQQHQYRHCVCYYIKHSACKSAGQCSSSKKEANLSKQSVVNVSQIFTVDKKQLEEKIGSLSMNRITEILDGIRLLTEPKDILQ